MGGREVVKEVLDGILVFSKSRIIERAQVDVTFHKIGAEYRWVVDVAACFVARITPRVDSLSVSDDMGVEVVFVNAVFAPIRPV